MGGVVRTISTRLAISGESEYKAALKSINADLSLHKSELAKVESAYRENANSMAALSAKGDVLQKQYDAQAKKVRQLSAALSEAQKLEAGYAHQVEQLSGKLERAKARREELRKSTEDTADLEKKLTAEIKKHEAALKSAEEKQQKANNTLHFYQKQTNYAYRDLNEFDNELVKNHRYQDEAKNSADGLATSIDRYGREVKRAGDNARNFGDTSKSAVDTLAAALAAAGVAATIQEIVAALRACVEASIEFESAVTGVFKTVDGTPEQLAAITDGIRRMATELPATTTEIAAVAEAAGQLGIATDDVLSFSRVMLDLGVSTNLSAEEAASALAKFANITGTAAADYGRLGSVIVGLGNNFSTTEADIVEMSTRLASAGTLAGLTEAEIMALATAMSSVGIEAEAGGTAMTQTLTAMEKAVAKGGDDLEAFARIAGMSAENFAETWETSAVTALRSFIAGLGRLDGAGESATLVLEELGLTGIRQSNMLKSLALSAENMESAVSLSNAAWAENTALTDEAVQRYGTLESRLTMMGNGLQNVKAAIGDALTPAIGELADAGADGFHWAADFIRDNPILVQAIAGVTVALGTLTAGVVGLAAATKILDAFKGALALLPMGSLPVLAITAAIAGLVTALGLFASSARKAADEAYYLSDAAKESKRAYEETAAAIQTEKADTMDMVTALEAMAGAANKTAAQKAAIKAQVEALNQAVPGLALAYNEEADALNLSVEAMKRRVQAAAEMEEMETIAARLNVLSEERIGLTEQEAEARARLEAAEQGYAETEEAVAAGVWNGNYALMEARTAHGQAKRAVEDSTAALEGNAAEAEELSARYDELAQSVSRTEEAAGGMSEQAKLTADELKELAARSDELTEATSTLYGAQDALSGALKEQEEKGSLSLGTTLELIDAGYAAAISIDAETGAVTLNKDAYIAIAEAKIEAQIQTLEAQRASVNAAIDLKKEAIAAKETAVGYLEKAAAARVAKAEAEDADLRTLEKQASAYDAQIASLNAAKKALGDYSGAAAATARAAGAASNKIKTQAEQDLEEFKRLKEDLDYERAMDEIEEEEYWARLGEYRDNYLTDESNLSEYRKINEQIYKHDKDLADQQEKLWDQQTETALEDWEKRLQGIADAYDDQMKEIKSAMEDLQAEQDAMAQKLAGYGDLFKIEDDRMIVEDLREQIDVMGSYWDTLSGLRERGVSDGLMDEILGMSIEDAIDYGNKLLEMAPNQWEKYNALWEEKQGLAVQIAENFYKEQMEAFEKDYEKKLTGALEDLGGEAFKLMSDVDQDMIDGLASKEQELYAKAQSIADQIAATLASAWAMSDGGIDGSHAGGLPYVPFDGYIAELHQGERVLTAEEAKTYIARSTPSSFELPRRPSQAETQAAAVVNGIVGGLAPMMSSAPRDGVFQININMEGKPMASVLFDPLKEVARQRGETLG